MTETSHKLAIGPGGRRIAYFNPAHSDLEAAHYPIPGIYTIDPTTFERAELFLARNMIEDGISAMAWSEATGRMAIITVYTPGGSDTILISEPIMPGIFNPNP